MGEGSMGSRLQEALRSLCFNTGWKYVVFWKLKQRARIMFTWEDAYYDGNQYRNMDWFNSTAGSLNEGPYSHDPLGLAVAKMSYQVYSLGEGVVGHVAVSGKHSWVFSDQHLVDSSFSSEYYGAWRSQFSAGIKTIATVAVIPHGVVQLGSLHKIAEDLKLVDHIKNVFSNLQDSFTVLMPSSSLKNTSLSDTCSRASNPAFHRSLAKPKGPVNTDEVNLWSDLISPLDESVNNSHILPPRGGFSNKKLKIKIHESTECVTPGNETLVFSTCENISTRRLHEGEMEFPDNSKLVGQTNGVGDLGKTAEINCTAPVENARIEKCTSYNASLPTEGSEVIASIVPPRNLESTAFTADISFPELPSLQMHQDFPNPDLPITSNSFEMQASPFSFCAGYELFEALGPTFQKQNNDFWEGENIGADMAVGIPNGMCSSSQLTENSDMHLLDAVVGRASHKGDGSESEISCRNTYIGESLLTAERTPCNSVGTLSTAGFSFDRDTSSSFNSVTCGVDSLKGISPTSSSRGSEHAERSRLPVKMSKKRARPGESSRPRPRDRQLIQDRIKELRELIPNGSKCSIDSLLERTIKHMIFMQSVSKHAEKLQKCSVSKLLDKDTGMRKFSSSEQGSSWAVEVGNNQKVCPIIVENINMNGQMLVEMMCKECNQFLDIAETIRSLGLNILKGVSEAYGNKAWICFVVENNRSMHRMDVLWSLMQLLQPKISN